MSVLDWQAPPTQNSLVHKRRLQSREKEGETQPTYRSYEEEFVLPARRTEEYVMPEEQNRNLRPARGSNMADEGRRNEKATSEAPQRGGLRARQDSARKKKVEKSTSERRKTSKSGKSSKRGKGKRGDKSRPVAARGRKVSGRADRVRSHGQVNNSNKTSTTTSLYRGGEIRGNQLSTFDEEHFKNAMQKLRGRGNDKKVVELLAKYDWDSDGGVVTGAFKKVLMASQWHITAEESTACIRYLGRLGPDQVDYKKVRSPLFFGFGVAPFPLFNLFTLFPVSFSRNCVGSCSCLQQPTLPCHRSSEHFCDRN